MMSLVSGLLTMYTRGPGSLSWTLRSGMSEYSGLEDKRRQESSQFDRDDSSDYNVWVAQYVFFEFNPGYGMVVLFEKILFLS